jgi:hypothetical protein
MSSRTTSAPRFGPHLNAIGGRAAARPQVNGAVAPKKKPRLPAPRDDCFVLLPSFHSEPTRDVLLQSAPGRHADRITVAYHSGDVEFDLCARGKTLLAGGFESDLALDGAPLVCRGDWQSVCWYADDDCDYLELRLCLSESVWIDRQILLSRRDHFALLADAVVASGANRIDYRISLPLANGVAASFDAKTREGRLVVPGLVARIFPLALAQDRVVSAVGSLMYQKNRLEMLQAGAGWGLYAPLLIDWHPPRRSAAAEWRALTVTETGKVVSPDRAAGHRLRLGRQQWLIYKTLDVPDDARAVLGLHTRYESVIGVFDSRGTVDPIVMVETE